MQKVVWERIRVPMPKGMPSIPKNAMNTMPRMISGVMRGRLVRYSITLRLRGRTRSNPTAPSVPTTPAAKLAESPRIRLLPSAWNMALSANRVRYHFSEKPPHTLESLLSLKE